MNLRVRVFTLAGCLAAASAVCAQEATEGDALMQLSRMSLEQLAKVEVTSVSKVAQSLSTAPASIYVITHEEIVDSGVTSIAEALRLAPNMQVARLTATEYSNGARGFAGHPDSQNFSNKILILIDGRSVYAPLFSGIAFDMQDVLMDDVDRIEVISGPGATLWGANAMNGVINIITRRATETPGTLLRLEGGAQEKAVAARYGGSMGGDDAFRVYAKWFDRGETELASGVSARDDWQKAQLGFRMDFSRSRHQFTLQGDYQHGQQGHAQQGTTLDDVDFTGANLLGRWSHAGDRITTRAQLFVDRVDRGKPPEGIAFDVNTYDVELQQSAAAGARHELVWGIGRRYSDYHTENNALAFEPDHRTLVRTNVFVQDAITLNEKLRLTAGLKFEEDSYSGWSALPDLRLSWAPRDSVLMWAAASRAIRAPTPFDTDVQEFVGGDLFLIGDPEFETEKVDAFEIGVRGTPNSRLTFSASVFHNEYDDLRTIEITPVTLLPLRWGNLMEGRARGVEAWATIQVNSWWRLSPGLRTVRKDLRFKQGSSELVGLAQAGNDPKGSYRLKSSMDLGRWSIDAMLRKVDRLPEPALDGYTDLQARVSFRWNERIEVAVKGFNLLDETHREYPAPFGREIPRSVMAELRYLY